MKKLRRFLVLTLTIVLVFLGTSCTDSCQSELDPATFDDFAQEVFYMVLGNDELTLNYLFEHPENYGLEHSEPSLPTPGLSSGFSKMILNFMIGRVKRYDYNKLNAEQQMTYNIIVDLIEKINAKSTEMGYLSNNYLGSYLGYQAQLPLLLVEYNFRSKLDVENYLKYLDLVPNTFKEYVEFENEKAKHGYGMPDFVIEKVVKQCQDFVSEAQTGNHFMIITINQKIDACDFLTVDEKVYFKAQNQEKVNGPLIEGYRYVEKELPKLKGMAKNNLGLAHTFTSDGKPIGKDYYELDFQDTVGYKISLEEAEQYIDEKLAYYETQLAYYRTLMQTDATFQNEISNYQLMKQSPEEQLAYYQTAFQTYFPPLSSTPLITVKYIDKAMEDHFSPAAYMTSAIDNFTEEFIYLNGADVILSDGTLDYNYLYSTLAHEGYPGHLYQNVYFKSKDVNLLRKVLKSSGYSEGWATYTELFSFELLRGTYSDTFVDFLIFQEEYNGAMYSRLDMGIHYDGWTLEEAGQFIHRYAPNATDSAIQATFEQLIEVPNNMQMYFFTYFKLKDLRIDIMNLAKEDFDYLTFHTYILDCGPAPLRFVEEYVRAQYE